MGDDHRAAGELQQRVLQGPQRLHVQVVGGLVQEDEVAPLLEGQRQVQPVALTAGEHPGRLLLVRPLEPEGGHVSSRGHLHVADLDVVQAVGDDLPQRLVRVDAGAGLVDVGQRDSLADRELAAVQRLQADDGLEQGGLAHPVWSHHTHDPVARQGEGQPLDEGAPVEALGQVGGLQDLVSQARTRRDLDLLEVQLAGALGLSGHLLVAGQAGLGLGLTPPGRGAHPLQLLAQAPGQLGVLLALDLQTLLLGLQVGGVVALVGVEATTVHLGNPLGHVVQEVAVVGHGDDRALVGSQVLLQPQDRLGVQVVGGLVQEEKVRGLQEQATQGHPAALTTGEVLDLGVWGRAAQRVHGLLQLGVQVPGARSVELVLEGAHLGHQGVEVGVRVSHGGRDLVEPVELALDLCHALLDVAEHGLLLVQRRLLQQDADAVARGQPGLAVGGLVNARHDLQDRGLAGAVGADHADLGSREESHGDVIQDDLVTVRLARLDHLVDEFSHRSDTPFKGVARIHSRPDDDAPPTAPGCGPRRRHALPPSLREPRTRGDGAGQ